MTTYISFPIDSNPDDLVQEAYAYIKAHAPQWVENDANLDTWILQVLAQQASDLRVLATDVPDSIFRYYGRTLVGLPPVEATPATTTSTWVMRDTAGYTIPAGTTVSIRSTAGDEIPFQTVVDVVIFAGSTTANNVVLQSVDPGTDKSALGTAGTIVTLQDTLDFVSSITLVAATTGGHDPETDTDYLSRLTTYLGRLSRRPVLPEDFASLFAEADPAIARAVAIDGYNPSSGTFNNERTVAVAGVDSNGANLSAPVKAAGAALLAANREINFVVNVVDPSRTTINVTFTAKVVAGFDPATVELAAEAAVANYLSPANWGHDPRFTDTGASRTWVETPVLRYFNVAQIIENVEGIDYIQSLLINGVGTDINLTTPAALTTPGTINGTVT